MAVLNGVGVAPVPGECPGGEIRRPVVGVLRSDASTKPQSGGSSSGGVLAARPLSSANLVGRDGIEPPTLRFSVVGPGVQQGAGSVIVLVRWHMTEQA